MDTSLDQLVSTDAQSGLIVTRGIPLSSFISENVTSASNEEFILDLSQRRMITTTTTTHTIEPINKNSSVHYINDWTNDSKYNYTDAIDNDFNRILPQDNDDKLNIEQSLTDQLKHQSTQDEPKLSDTSNKIPSKLDYYSSLKKTR